MYAYLKFAAGGKFRGIWGTLQQLFYDFKQKFHVVWIKLLKHMFSTWEPVEAGNTLHALL